MRDIFTSYPLADLRNLFGVRKAAVLYIEVAQEDRFLLAPLGLLSCNGGSGQFSVEQNRVDILEVLGDKTAHA